MQCMKFEIGGGTLCEQLWAEMALDGLAIVDAVSMGTIAHENA